MWKEKLLQLARYIEKLNEWVGQKISWLTLLLVLMVCFDVFTRYLLSSTSAWMMELEWHLFALIFLLGAGYALKHDRHVRVDLFYNRFTDREQALVDFIGTLLFLIPWTTAILFVSWKYAITAWRIKETSPDPGGLPAIYPIKFAIALGLLLLLLQGIATLIKTGIRLFSTDQSTQA